MTCNAITINEVNPIESSRPYCTYRVFTPLGMNITEALKGLKNQGLVVPNGPTLEIPNSKKRVI